MNVTWMMVIWQSDVDLLRTLDVKIFQLTNKHLKKSISSDVREKKPKRESLGAL